jgi:predicted Zn-dependent protease
LVTSAGGRIERCSDSSVPARRWLNAGAQTQRRTGGGVGTPAQGGLEQLARLGFPRSAPQVAEEALALLQAPECPTGRMDLLLMPGQMILQIHESVGHPLELDRILGDERNYAGTSFVTPDMFGRYRYGSEPQASPSIRIPRSLRATAMTTCEIGRLIEDGEIMGMVRNPNYRGISATSLAQPR